MLLSSKLIPILLLLCFASLSINAQQDDTDLRQDLESIASDSHRIIFLEEKIRAQLFSNPENALKLAEQYAKIGKGMKSDFFEGKGLNFAGISLVQLGKGEKAIGFYLQALNHFEATKDTFYIALVCNNIGTCYKESKDLKKTLSYYDRARHLFEAIKDTTWLANSLNNLGVIYSSIADYDKAESFFSQATAYYEQLNNQTYLKAGYINLSSIAEYRNDLDLAVAYIQKAIAIPDSVDRQDHLMALNNLAGYYLKQKKLAQSKKILDQVKASPYYENFIDRQRQWEEIYSRWLVENGDYKNALLHFKTYIELKDSINNQQKETQLQEILAQYETEKKEAQLKEKEIQLIKAAQQRNILWTIVGFLLLISFSSILFFRQQLRNNKKLAELNTTIYDSQIRKLEQEKLLVSSQSLLQGQIKERKRIAQDLHDSLGGLWTSIKAHYRSLANLSDFPKTHDLHIKTEKMIDESYQELRRISHDMMPPGFLAGGIKEALEHLPNQLKEHFDLVLTFTGLLDDLDEITSLTIYRILQEALQNIQKHAHATEVFIQFFRTKDQLHITIEDDGQGFDPSKIIEQKKGVGFTNMQERIQALRGHINIESTPGSGTLISLELPLEKALPFQ